MSDEQAAELMNKFVFDEDDPQKNQEEDHYNADDLLCDILLSLGYEKTVHKYHEVGKWYS